MKKFYLHKVVCSKYTLYPPNIVRVFKSIRSRYAGQVGRMEESRSSFKILKGKTTGKRLLGSPSRRWEDNIRMDLKKIGINTRNLAVSAVSLKAKFS